MSGSAWATYMTSSGGRITMGTTPPGPRPGADRYVYGFPFITGEGLVRNTGTALGDPAITTLSAQGGDEVAPSGVRNVSLVACSLALYSSTARTSSQVGIDQIALPESRRVPALLARAEPAPVEPPFDAFLVLLSGVAATGRIRCTDGEESGCPKRWP